MRVDRDVLRAAAVQQYSALVTTAGDEVLVVDLAPPAAFANKHWIVEQLTFIASIAVRAISQGISPISGMFLCPPGTPAEQSSDTTDATIGWTRSARGILLPIHDPSMAVAQIGAGPPYAIAMVVEPGFKFTVPKQWFLRAILSCAPGTVTPGPGAGSIGELKALCVPEPDDPCQPY